MDEENRGRGWGKKNLAPGSSWCEGCGAGGGVGEGCHVFAEIGVKQFRRNPTFCYAPPQLFSERTRRGGATAPVMVVVMAGA